MTGEVPGQAKASSSDGSEPTMPIDSESRSLDESDLNSSPDLTIAENNSSDSEKPLIASEEELNESQSIAQPDNEARLQQLEQEHETLKTQYMRIAADFDNFRKRQSRDQDDLKLQLTCSTLSEILPVVDNFERARQQLDPQGEEAQTLHRSYQGLYKQLVDVLKQLGVAPMRVVGQPFDPNLHEAVLREPSEEQAEDIVTEELQRGYHLNGRVLRHALVKVSMGPGPKDGISLQTEDLKSSSEVSSAPVSESLSEEN